MSLVTRPRRSVLFLPATNPRAVAKARTLPCDAVVLDLEDAVGPAHKAAARDAAVAVLREGGFGPRETAVRINALATPWGEDDLRAVCDAGAAAVVLPKVSSPADLDRAGALRGGARLWCMIETCAAIMHLPALGEASGPAGADLWLVGANDLAKEMRCRPGLDRAPLYPALALTVMAARAHGLSVVDAVFNDIADEDGFARECAQGARLGFDGKSLIHPGQIAAANAAFGPSPEDLAGARDIVAAFESPENLGKGVISLAGRMVERLHLEEARRLIALAEASATEDEGS